LTPSTACGTNSGRPAPRGERSKKVAAMRALSVFGESIASLLLVALADAGAYAQQEIDPDHCDSPSTEPPDQPKSGQSHGSATGFDGNFSLPYAAQCSGRQLAPGKYSVSLRSDGKVGHEVLKSKSQSIEITSVVHPQGFRRGDDLVVVGSKAKVRTLSAIQISGVNFVFDPIFTVDTSSSSKKKHIETLPLTLVSFKSSQNLDSP